MSNNNRPPNAPVNAFERAERLWFESYGSSVVNSSRWFLVSMILAAAVIGLAISIMVMMPLKTVKPYVIKVANDGQVSATTLGVQNYKPEEREIRYFLSQWVTKLYTLDHSLSEQRYLPDAYALTRDKAIAEFTSWIDVNKPLVVLATDPTITQSVAIKSISFIQDGVALVRIRYDTRTSQKVIQTDRLVTIHYALIPPVTDKDIYDNPIGLFITHFAVSEDIQ